MDEWEELSNLLNSPKGFHPTSKTYGKNESGLDVAFGLYNENTMDSPDSFLLGLQQEEMQRKFRLPPNSRMTRTDKDSNGWDDRSMTFSPRISVKSAPDLDLVQPLDESLSNLRDEKERKKNATLKLRVEGLQKTIRELERRLHEKDREVLRWKQKAGQSERQVKTLSNLVKQPPKSRVEIDTRQVHLTEHRRVEAKLQNQIDELLQEVANHRSREARLAQLNGMLRMRCKDLQDTCQSHEQTIDLYENDMRKLKKKVSDQARKLKRYAPSDEYRLEGLPSAAQLVEEINAVTQQQQDELDRSKRLRQEIQTSSRIETPVPEPLQPPSYDKKDKPLVVDWTNDDGPVCASLRVDDRKASSGRGAQPTAASVEAHTAVDAHSPQSSEEISFESDRLLAQPRPEIKPRSDRTGSRSSSSDDRTTTASECREKKAFADRADKIRAMYDRVYKKMPAIPKDNI